MTNAPDIAEIAALLGDPARANMLSALMDGRALSAGELAYAAHVTPQTASAHLESWSMRGFSPATGRGATAISGSPRPRSRA